MELFVGIAAFVCACVCTLLVFHPDYEDGLIGRVGLVFMALAAMARIVDLMQHSGPISQIGVLLWIGLAIFLSRHFWRFLKWRRCGVHDWRKADVLSSGGKVSRS